VGTRGRVAIVALVAVLGLGALIGYWYNDAQVTDSEPACTIAGAAMTIDPDQARSAATIAAVAVQRNLSERAVVIALATALQESKLYNLDYGDRDSIGLFQQRPSQGWGKPSDLKNPQYATGAFYDALMKVPNWRTRPLTQVAQAVQRSGYPDAYAKWEDIARPLAAALMGSRAAGLTCNYDQPTKTADADTVFADLSAELPATRAGTVDFAAPSARDGWRIAAWLTANGERLGIYSVSYGGKTWSYDADAWKPAQGATAAVHVTLTNPSS
jgi:hypothetical protein